MTVNASALLTTLSLLRFILHLYVTQAANNAGDIIAWRDVNPSEFSKMSGAASHEHDILGGTAWAEPIDFLDLDVGGRHFSSGLYTESNVQDLCSKSCDCITVEYPASRHY